MIKADYIDATKEALLKLANEANPIDLELAATAIYIAQNFR